MISRVACFFTRVLFGLKVHDPTSGFRAYSSKTLNSIDMSKVSKNNALSYEIIRSSSLLASFIFVPLGTLLSLFISVESLIIIVVFMSITSITPIVFHNRVLST